MPGTLQTAPLAHRPIARPAGHARADAAQTLHHDPAPFAPETDLDSLSSEAPAATLIPLFRFDPGWLFLLSGIVLLAAVVLIPAQHDLDEARWQRNRALAIESNRTERLDRYGAYLAAIRADEPCVLLSLAATQLNVSPANRIPLQPMADIERTSASVFPLLEPGELNLPPKPAAFDESHRQDLSILERLSINNGSRLWLIAAGTLCTLLGLLPSAGRAVSSATGVAAGSALSTFGTAIGAGATAVIGETSAAISDFRSRIAEHDDAVASVAQDSDSDELTELVDEDHESLDADDEQNELDDFDDDEVDEVDDDEDDTSDPGHRARHNLDD